MALNKLIEEIPLPSWIKDLILSFLLIVGVLGTVRTVKWLWSAVGNFFRNLYARIMWQDFLRLESNDGVRLINIWNKGKLDISDIEVFIWDVKSERQMPLCRDSPEKPITLKQGECEQMMLFELRDSFTATTLVFIFYPVLGWRKQWVGVCVPPVGCLSYYLPDFEEFEKGFGEPSVLTRKIDYLPRKIRRCIDGKACETGFVPSPLSPYVRLRGKEHMEKVRDAGVPALVRRLHRELDPDRLERFEEPLRQLRVERSREFWDESRAQLNFFGTK